MDSFLSRYRNLTVLLILVVAQLFLLGYQVRANRDVRLIRVWSVSAVTPLARVLEAMRQHTFGVFEDYFVLLGIREENRKLHDQLGSMKLQNQFLRTQLSDADRARALTVFQTETPSRTLAARVIANGTGSNSVTVFVDRGAPDGVETGMAVVTPDGIVGKVVAAYPTASLVMLVTDPTFAAGVVSLKNHVAGTLKGQGHGTCVVDYIQNEQKVEPGEWFYTSGYDRVFPRGFPAGQATVVRNGRNGKEVYLNPSGLQGGPEGVLVVLQGVHQKIPDNAPPAPGMRILSPPSDAMASSPAQPAQPALGTQADDLRQAYEKIAKDEKHQFGAPGAIPNFNLKRQPPPASPAATPTLEGAAIKPPSVPAKPPGAASASVDLTGPPRPKPIAPKPVNAQTAGPAALKKPTGPLLITDPADADPSAPEVLKAISKPKAGQPLDSFGQPVPGGGNGKTAAKPANPGPAPSDPRNP